MGKVNVICATAPWPNPGMASVDLAFLSLAKRHGLEKVIRFWQIYTSTERHSELPAHEQNEIRRRESVPFQYQNLREHAESVLSGDSAVVYWGDFLHMARYQRNIARNLVALGVVETTEEGVAYSQRHFFLSDSSADTLKKTLAFGGNLLFNTAADYSNSHYQQILSRFLKGVDSIWMRDAFSAMSVGRLRGSSAQEHLGFDCSLFLKEGDLDSLQREWTQDKTLGVGKVGLFFDRSQNGTSRFGSFSNELCQKLGLESQWLPWRRPRKDHVGHHFFNRWAFRNMERIDLGTPPYLGDLYELIKRYRFIITDTYHVCVNAWRLGTPAICIGDVAPQADWDVSAGPAFSWRDKRWIFYAMNDAQYFFVHSRELQHYSWRHRRIDQLAELLQSPDMVSGVINRILSERDGLETQLVAAIRRCASLT